MTPERKTRRLFNRLVVACTLARDEIHHPGSARTSGIDIHAMLDGIIAEATKSASFDVSEVISAEMRKLASMSNPHVEALSVSKDDEGM